MDIEIKTYHVKVYGLIRLLLYFLSKDFLVIHITCRYSIAEKVRDAPVVHNDR